MHIRAHMRSSALRLAPVLVAAALAGPAALPALRWPSACAGPARGRPARAASLSQTTLCLLNRQRAGHALGALSLELAHRARRLAPQPRHGRPRLLRPRRSHRPARPRRVLPRSALLDDRGEHRLGLGSYATPQSIVWMWMHSPGHRANTLNGQLPRDRRRARGRSTGTRVRRAATYTTDFGGLRNAAPTRTVLTAPTVESLFQTRSCRGPKGGEAAGQHRPEAGEGSFVYEPEPARPTRSQKGGEAARLPIPSSTVRRSLPGPSRLRRTSSRGRSSCRASRGR